MLPLVLWGVREATLLGNSLSVGHIAFQQDSKEAGGGGGALAIGPEPADLHECVCVWSKADIL